MLQQSYIRLWKDKNMLKRQENVSSPEYKSIGNSILKHVQGYEISKSLENCKTYLKSFSSAKIRDMKDYVKQYEKTQTKLLLMMEQTI